jgi:hypothetical protein
MKLLGIVARVVFRACAFARRHQRLMRSAAWVGSHWWVGLFGVAAWLIVQQPNHAALDSGSIFALAGLAVVVLSLTFPVILLIVQNLSQRSAKDLLEEFKRQALWREPMATQAAAIILIIGGGLWHATVSSGAAALLLLLALFGEGYGAFKRLLTRMNPIILTNHLVERRTAELRRYRSAGLFGQPLADTKAKEALESVLDLAEAAIASRDLELVRVSLDRANDVCLAYLDVSFGMGYGDPVSDVLTVRLGSVLNAARSSTSVILPEVTKRIGAIGATIAGYQRQGFMDPGHVPYSIIALLTEAFGHGIGDDRSRAPGQAVRGITDIGTAYISARRIAATQRPIQQLRAVIRAGGKAKDQFFLRQAGTGLIEIAHGLSAVPAGDVMVPACLEHARDALKELADVDADGRVPGAATFIANPIDRHGFNLGSVTVQVVRQAIACNDAYHRDEFARIARSLFNITRTLAASEAADIQTRGNATRVLTGIMLAAIGEHVQNALPELIEEWWNATVTLLIEDKHARESLDVSEYHLAELLLTAFYAQLDAQDAPDALLRRLLDSALEKVAEQPERDRWILSPVLRLLGAAAIKNDVGDLADSCADIVIPPPARGRKSLAYGDWFYTPHLDDKFMPLPSRAVSGMTFPQLRADHNDPVARRQFLDLENPDITDLSDTLTWQYWPREESSMQSPFGDTTTEETTGEPQSA